MSSSSSTPKLATELTSTETLGLGALSLACVSVLANAFRGDGEPLVASLALSGLAFTASYAMIRWLGPTFIRAGLRGRDMSKVNNKQELPECMGAICAVVYLIIIMVFIPFPFYKDIVVATSGGGNRDVVMNVEYVQQGRLLHKFPHSKVSHKFQSMPIPVYAIEFHQRHLPMSMRPKVLTRHYHLAGIFPISHHFTPVHFHSRHWRRSLRHSLATQVLHSGFRLDTPPRHLLCRFRRNVHRPAHRFAALRRSRAARPRYPLLWLHGRFLHL
jgi:hypothetical protein